MDNKKVLAFFIKEPEKEFHVRQIARLLKKSPTTVSKYLKNYAKQGILKSEKKFHHLLFKANIENKEFKLLRLNHNIHTLNKSKLMRIEKTLQKLK